MLPTGRRSQKAPYSSRERKCRRRLAARYNKNQSRPREGLVDCHGMGRRTSRHARVSEHTPHPPSFGGPSRVAGTDRETLRRYALSGIGPAPHPASPAGDRVVRCLTGCHGSRAASVAGLPTSGSSRYAMRYAREFVVRDAACDRRRRLLRRSGALSGVNHGTARRRRTRYSMLMRAPRGTCAYSQARSSSRMRMQPCVLACPIVAAFVVP